MRRLLTCCAGPKRHASMKWRKKTTLERASLLSARLGSTVLLKREDQQPVFSSNCAARTTAWRSWMKPSAPAGVIAASAGNHAQGVALAASRLEIQAMIVMPVTAPQVKVDAVRRFGGRFAQVVLAGDSYSDAQAEAIETARRARRHVRASFRRSRCHRRSGHYCAGKFWAQHPGPLHAVFVPIGGGGLISGIAAIIKARRPRCTRDRRASQRCGFDGARARCRYGVCRWTKWACLPMAPPSNKWAR